MEGADHPSPASLSGSKGVATKKNKNKAPELLPFQIPSELQDVEREPYLLDRYPADFRLNDAAESFDELLRTVEDGNRNDHLRNYLLQEEEGTDALIDDDGEDEDDDGSTRRGRRAGRRDDDDSNDEDDGDDPGRINNVGNDLHFISRERFQALYTLVRKSSHLEPAAKQALVDALADAVNVHCHLLRTHAQKKKEAVAPRVRDSFACHLYLLYSTLVLMESSFAASSSSGSDTNMDKEIAESQHKVRARAMDALLAASQTMMRFRNALWQRGVMDEGLVLLPAKVSYRMLEKSRIVTARKLHCGDQALLILATIMDACGDNNASGDNHSNSSAEASLFTTVSATLMDLMHGFEHMAPMCCELCTTTLAQVRSSGSGSGSGTTYGSGDALAIELLREVVRVAAKARGNQGGGGGPDGIAQQQTAKASGIALVAPFIALLAEARPHLVLQHMSVLVAPLLNASQAYNVRSAVVQAIKHVLDHLGRKEKRRMDNDAGDATEEEDPHDRADAGAGLAETTKSRDALLNLLMERAYDTSSYTRAASLKALSQLVAGGTLPLKTHLLGATQLAMDRLVDKTVVVRKQAMQLLTNLLENHPFLESLNPDPYRAKLKELYEWIKTHFPEAVQATFDDAVQQLNNEGQGDESVDAAKREEAMLELEEAALAAAITEAEALLAGGSDDDNNAGIGAVAVELTEPQQEYVTKVRALQFTQSALEFIAVLEDATAALESMLLSSSTSDVVEALRFFVQARHFELPCAVTGMKRALALLWSSEPATRDEVIKSFVDVFIHAPGSDPPEPLPDQHITKNLLVLTAQATASELVSIEEAIQQLVATEVIPPNVFLILWSLSSTGPSDTRAAAVRLLAMGAAADASIVDSKSRLKLLLGAGFGTYARKRRDWRLVEAASICLQRVERAKVDVTDAKYLVLELILEQLQAVARGDWCIDTQKDTMEWFPAAEQAIKALFRISPQPEVVSRTVLLQMYKSTFQEPNSVHPLRLARFFHILGQVSLQLLVYTEALCSSVRRVNAKKSLKRQEDADQAKSHRRNASGASSGSGSDDNAIESELGIAAEVEAENERAMSEIAEKEIVGRNLLAQFGPLLARVVANEDGLFGKVQILTQAAMLALVKLMCVSSKFCEDHLTLLFSALANAPPEDTTMRANTVVALGDLAFRFPNEVEPYTPHLYACLRDTSTKVRRHTLMVLTHLILNDMIRVKGQVCEIALCLRDDDPRIRDMSRLLFHELSKRTNNPIYNLLPDIISNLGQVGSTNKEDFRGIMTFLLGFIKKDRQNEMLVDKLCHRFPTSGSTSQKADLAYCIAQLKMTERSIKCLNDNFKLYKDALHDDDVYKSFLTIATKAKKKFTAGEASQLLEDWEAKISDAAIIGAENEDAEGKASRASQKAGRKVQRKKKAAPQFDAIMEGDDEEDELAEPDGTPPAVRKKAAAKKKKPVPSKRSARKKRPAAKPVLDDDDDEGDSNATATDDEMEFQEAKGNKENTPKRPSRQAKVSARQRRGAPVLSD